MEFIRCKTCKRQYEVALVEPRSLDCGHSICTRCVSQVLQISRVCPICKIALIKTRAEDYPVNYELTQIVDTLNNTIKAKKTLREKAIAMKSKYTPLQNELIKNFSSVTMDLNSIQKLLDNEDFDSEARKKLLELGETLDAASKKTNLGISVTHSRSNYENDDEFVRDIYNRLSNHEEFYAVMKIKDKIKFARLLNVSDKIMVHSFDSPVEKNDIKTTWFEDLKECLCRYATHAFLDLNCHAKGKHITLTIEIRSSTVATQFMKYCTGELGPVYKGSTFTNETLAIPSINEESETIENTHRVIKVDNFMLDGIESCGSLEYISFVQPYTYVENDEIICFCNIFGSFQIIENFENHSIQDTDVNGTVIGVINTQKDLFRKLLDSNSCYKIRDCGIIFDLEHQFVD